jgi:hypothetical protein
MKVFGFIHKVYYISYVIKFIKKLFMGFSASNIIGGTKIERQPDPNELTPQEIELLLYVLKNTMFKGEQLEPLYDLVVKLQNQHASKIK